MERDRCRWYDIYLLFYLFVCFFLPFQRHILKPNQIESWHHDYRLAVLPHDVHVPMKFPVCCFWWSSFSFSWDLVRKDMALFGLLVLQPRLFLEEPLQDSHRISSLCFHPQLVMPDGCHFLNLFLPGISAHSKGAPTWHGHQVLTYMVPPDLLDSLSNTILNLI